MITVQYMSYYEQKFKNTYEFVEFLKKEGYIIPKEFRNTHWMKMFNKLNQGIKIYYTCDPYQCEIHERVELMWSSSLVALKNRCNILADDI